MIVNASYLTSSNEGKRSVLIPGPATTTINISLSNNYAPDEVVFGENTDKLRLIAYLYNEYDESVLEAVFIGKISGLLTNAVAEDFQLSFRSSSGAYAPN